MGISNFTETDTNLASGAVTGTAYTLYVFKRRISQIPEHIAAEKAIRETYSSIIDQIAEEAGKVRAQIKELKH